MAIQDFVRAGRTGRRNALPDVMSAQHIQVSTAGLSEVLEGFNFNASPEDTTCQNGSNSTQQPNPTQGSPT